MSVSNNMGGGLEGLNFDKYLNLSPPGSEKGMHGSILINGKPDPLLGGSGAATLVAHLGYSDKDTIGSALDEILEMAAQLNISIMVNLKGDEAVIAYLGSFDPSLPTLQPLKAFLKIAEKALEKGIIGGNVLGTTSKEQGAASNDAAEVVKEGIIYSKDFKDQKDSVTSAREGEQEDINGRGANSDLEKANKDLPKTSYQTEAMETQYGIGILDKNFNKHLETQDKISNVIKDGIEAGRTNAARELTSAEVTLGKAEGGNKWLQGNVYVTFLLVFMELQRILMQNKVVQGGVELAGMNLVVELAKTTADMIMDIAKMNQMIHIVTAVMSGVAIVFSVGGIALSSGLAQKGAFKAGLVDSPKAKANSLDMGGVVGGLGASFEKMATAATQAATDITIAEKEGYKEVLQAYRQLAQHQMDKAGESMRSSEDQIQQLLQGLDKIRDGLEQAIAASLRK